MSRLEETIVAIASPHQGAARGIVRLSGPDVLSCLRTLFQADGAKTPSDVGRPTSLCGSLHITPLGSPLPCELYFWPGRRSYTGEPVAELHTLGCPPLLHLTVERLCEHGARLAQPGEFTLRAFLSRRLDLVQAEAVLGVIDAADQRQLDVALQQLAGGLSRPLGGLRDSLLELLAHLEAGFDFADEDLPFITPEQLRRRLADAAEITARLARQIQTRNSSDTAPRVVLAGRPNTGKSSLFNALVAFANSQLTKNDDQHRGRPPQAIVSRQPGTTRDYLTARLDLDGAVCCLIDTAGIEPTAGAGGTLPAGLQHAEEKSSRSATGDNGSASCERTDREWIAQESQSAARDQMQTAQVRIFCIEATRLPDAWEEVQIASHLRQTSTADGPRQQLIVLTKTDAAATMPAGSVDAIPTSSITGEGVAELWRRLGVALRLAAADSSDVVAPTALRCGQSLRLAAESLARARRIAAGQTATGATNSEINAGVANEELIAAELRFALDELGKVVGTVYSDDVLENIFSRFCIGK